MSRGSSDALRLALGLVGVAAVTFVYVNWLHVSNATTVSMSFLMVVLAVAATSRLWIAVPAMFILAFPQLSVLNMMRLRTPESAILSAVIFNAVIIIGLIPLALKGIAYKPVGAAALLRRNMLVYGAGGVVLPFLGIKAIDIALVAVGLA